MLWHAGIPFVAGGFVGVDVFFVISGFLMTTLLLRDIDASGRVPILGFYARRARRLLPAAAVALAGTAVITILVLPPIRWSADGRGHRVGGAVCGQLAVRRPGRGLPPAGSAPSPVLHFWSLAVEEQFYLVLPVLLAVICLLSTRRLRRFAVGVALVWPGSPASCSASATPPPTRPAPTS